MTPGDLHIRAVHGLPEIRPGAALGRLIARALADAGRPLELGDIVVVTHKVVAKAENALVDLATITPSALAVEFALRWNKDPRHIEVVLRQSARIVRMDRGVIISETRHGFVCANAGVDASNMIGGDVVCLLPDDPDRSAAEIADQIEETGGLRVPVIVCDTFGRPWREGLTNVAIGVAGLLPLHDYVGKRDSQGRELKVTALAVADEIAGAAELVMGKLDRAPAAVIRGFPYQQGKGSAGQLLRKAEMDMFR
jgi:coenzyme F420-0:L-glutamate ligase/coenzyme F420-1:gamma-L-glutamate ligase